MNGIDLTFTPPPMTLPDDAWQFAIAQCSINKISLSTYLESLILKEQTIAEAERQLLSAPSLLADRFVPANDADA